MAATQHGAPTGAEDSALLTALGSPQDMTLLAELEHGALRPAKAYVAIAEIDRSFLLKC